MKRFFLIAMVLMSLNCCSAIKEEPIIIASDPHPLGLLSNNPLPILQMPLETFQNYDSLFLYYCVAVAKPKISDSCHANLTIKRMTNHKGFVEEGWNYIELYGCFTGDSSRVLLDIKGDLFGNDAICKDSVLLHNIENKLFEILEQRSYFFDENDWKEYRGIYLNSSLKQLFLCGEIAIISTTKYM